METTVSARPRLPAGGGRSNGVRPSLSSAFLTWCLSCSPTWA